MKNGTVDNSHCLYMGKNMQALVIHFDFAQKGIALNSLFLFVVMTHALIQYLTGL